MKNIMRTLLIVLMILTACVNSATFTPTSTQVSLVIPTNTSIPTIVPSTTLIPTAFPISTTTARAVPSNIPTPTISPLPQARVVTENATLYSGPATIGYEILDQLSEGTQLTLIGTFGDFVKVHNSRGTPSREGFVPKSTLDDVPNNLLSLTEDQVPWKSISDILAEIYDPKSSLRKNYLSLDNSNGNDWYAYDIGPIPLNTPLRINLNLDESTGEYAALTLSGRIRQTGPWWNGLIRMNIAIIGNALSLEIQDGRSETSTLRIALRSLSARSPFSLLFLDPNGKQFRVADKDGKIVETIDVTTLEGAVLPNGLFPDGTFYLGTLVAAKSQLVVDGLELLERPRGVFTAPTESPTPLRELAKRRGIEIGAAGLASIYPLRDPRYSAILATEFDRLVLEEFLWSSIRPSKDTYDFSNADLMVDYGIKHKMQIEGHHLAWGDPDHLPQWLKNGSFTRDELIAILHDHVTTVVSRYKGRVSSWTVANETVSRTIWNNSALDFWYTHIGPDYVEMAFRWASEADPNVTLIYNQENAEDRSNPITSKTSDATYNLIKQLKDKGVKVDGLGMQMHLLSPYAGDKVNPPKKEDVVANMRRFAELGVQIYVTEFDVNLTNVAGSTSQKRAFQAKVYKDMLEACLGSGVCRAFSMFGFTDLVTWYNVCEGCLNLPNAQPLPYDTNYQPKPAYFALHDALSVK